MLTSSNGARKLLGVNNNLEPAHNTTKILCPNDSVRVSISLFAKNIGLIVWCGKKVFAAK